MEEKRDLKIAVHQDTKPSFANATHLTVNDDSVTIQFAYVRPNSDQGQLMSEIVLTPKHAMEFQKILDGTLKKHFTKHLND